MPLKRYFNWCGRYVEVGAQWGDDDVNHNKEAPCAMCGVPNTLVTTTLTGTTSCPTGYDKIYGGAIFGDREISRSKEYLCVPDDYAGSGETQADTNGGAVRADFARFLTH